MRAIAFASLSALLVIGGCEGYGGAVDGGEEGPATFSVTGRFPGPHTSGVPVSSYVEVTFSDLIDTSSVEDDAIQLNGAAYGTVTVNGTKLRFTPSYPMTTGTPYAVSLDPALRGRNGHLLGSSPVWGFKTDGPTPDSLPPLGPRPR